MELSERPIVVLGMQRSGTSAVSGALSRLGIYMGADEDFFPPDANIAGGYFEQRALTTINHKCLAFYQMHATSLRPLPTSWKSYPQAKMLVEELRGFLVEKFRGRLLWGFKQPMASLLEPIYSAVFTELGLSPQYVVCVRNPIEIQASEADWKYQPGGRQMAPLGAHAIGAWLRYTLGALEAAGERPLTIIHYSSFLENPRPFLFDIVEKQGSSAPSEQQWSEALSCVRPDMRRQNSSGKSLGEYPSIVRETLAYCASSKFDATRQSALVKEFNGWLDMLEPPRLSGTRLGFAWKGGNAIQSVQEPFLPAGDWQTVRLEINAEPLTELNGLFYNKPCRVWIKRCVFIHEGGETAASIYSGPGSHLTSFEGTYRLEGAYEARQISLATPAAKGPYTLEIEFLLESGSQIINDSASRIAGRLHECAARRHTLERRLNGGLERPR